MVDHFILKNNTHAVEVFTHNNESYFLNYAQWANSQFSSFKKAFSSKIT